MNGDPRKTALAGFPYFYGPLVLFGAVLPSWPFYVDTGQSQSMWTYAGGSVAPVFVTLTALLIGGLLVGVWAPRSMTGVAIAFVASVLLSLCVPFAWRFIESDMTSAGSGAVVVYMAAAALTGGHGLVLTLSRSPSRRDRS